MENVHYGTILQNPNSQSITEEIMSSFEQICQSVFNSDGEWDIDE